MFFYTLIVFFSWLQIGLMDTIDNRENLLKRLAGPTQVNILMYNEFQKKILLAFCLFYMYQETIVGLSFLTQLHGHSLRLTNTNVICKMISSGFPISKFLLVQRYWYQIELDLNPSSTVALSPWGICINYLRLVFFIFEMEEYSGH